MDLSSKFIAKYMSFEHKTLSGVYHSFFSNSKVVIELSLTPPKQNIFYFAIELQIPWKVFPIFGLIKAFVFTFYVSGIYESEPISVPNLILWKSLPELKNTKLFPKFIARFPLSKSENLFKFDLIVSLREKSE